jgi:hypothetical protein
MKWSTAAISDASRDGPHRRWRFGVERLEPRRCLAAGPLIAEFVSSNLGSLVDGYDETPDWIEIYNASDQAIDLHGYFLTDDRQQPQKWAFPEAIYLPARDRLVVFASGRDAIVPIRELHSNFQLDAEGEYLALVDAHGLIWTEFDAEHGTFPPLQPDLSYGFPETDSTFATVPELLAAATPGEANVENYYHGILPSPVISAAGGIYDAPLQVTIEAPVSGAALVYTTDGNSPTAAHGTVVEPTVPSEPAKVTLTVETTTVLQVITAQDGWLSPLPIGHTYLFLEDVLRQDPLTTDPGRFPLKTILFDFVYDFDPRLLTGNEAAMVQSLRALPSVAIVMDHDSLWADDTGIYTNASRRGPAWRRSGSVEVFDDEAYFFSQAHLQIAGGSSRHNSSKHGFRVDFRDDLGASDQQFISPLPKLSQMPVESVALRVNSQDSLQMYQAGSTYLRDTWVRDTLLAMGSLQASSDFAHLYVNGLYWGIITITERVRSDFLGLHRGGDGEDYDILLPATTAARTEVVQGDMDAWLRLFEAVRQPDLSAEDYFQLQGRDAAGHRDPAVEPLLNVPSLLDYMLIHVVARPHDWIHNNVITARADSPYGTGFEFFVWDRELTLRDAGDDVLEIDDIEGLEWSPLEIFFQLFRVPEFRMDVADAIYANYFHDGSLTLEHALGRWHDLAETIEPAIFAEVARWAGVEPRPPLAPLPYWTVNDWQSAVDHVASEILPRNFELAMDGFRQYGWYPTVEPPQVNRRGGEVPEGFVVTLLKSSGEGVIYYALDGSDPRAVGGAVHPQARRYDDPIRLERSTQLRARVLSSSGEWSAVEDVMFEIDVEDAGPQNLRITEVHYHPEPDGDSEFLELTNVGPRTIRLDQVRLEGGVAFNFAQSAVKRLNSGERLVLVRDIEAFNRTYGSDGVAIAGQYSGNLSNGGEQMTLRDTSGQIIQQFHYRDDLGWPTLPDGGGQSLQLIDPFGDADQAGNWRASAVIGGTPGREEYPVGDSNLDGRFDSGDLVLVFQAGQYEDAVAGNSSWAAGDWNGDGEFTTADLVLAFQLGTYVAASIAAPVP